MSGERSFNEKETGAGHGGVGGGAGGRCGHDGPCGAEANTYRVVLYDDQGSVVSQVVENATSCDFSQFMTKDQVNYYFEVTAIARNGEQRDYLKDGGPVSSLASHSLGFIMEING